MAWDSVVPTMPFKVQCAASTRLGTWSPSMPLTAGCAASTWLGTSSVPGRPRPHWWIPYRRAVGQCRSYGRLILRQTLPAVASSFWHRRYHDRGMISARRSVMAAVFIWGSSEQQPVPVVRNLHLQALSLRNWEWPDQASDRHYFRETSSSPMCPLMYPSVFDHAFARRALGSFRCSLSRVLDLKTKLTLLHLLPYLPLDGLMPSRCTQLIAVHQCGSAVHAAPAASKKTLCSP